MSAESIGAVLVCGAGIAGIQASLDLAESGFKVYLLDSSAAIGGRMAQIDRVHQTGDCSMCLLSPRLIECARNRTIEIITLAEVERISGEPGNFSVGIRRRPAYVDAHRCDSCGRCAEVCPVSLPSEFDLGIGRRKAIFRPYPQSIPNVFTISKSETPAPCTRSCPAGVNVQGLVALTGSGRFREAYELILKNCPFPASAGRICHQPCRSGCSRGKTDRAVAIGRLERAVAEHAGAPPDPKPAVPSNRRVAIVGGGPAGLAAAAALAVMGHETTIFEARPSLGGMLRYAIPEFRLPKDIVDREIGFILRLGVKVATSATITRPRDLLRSSVGASGFDAVFVASGAGRDRALHIPGEGAQGVWESLRFLEEAHRGKLPPIGPAVLVLGSGDQAVDAARSAVRLDGVHTVHLACMEGREEMPVDPARLADAVAEGVTLHHGLGPTRFVSAGGAVSAVAFRACTSVFDSRGRFDPLFDDRVSSMIHAGTVIVAAGRRADCHLGLELRPGGRILVSGGSLATSVAGVFTGGDAVLGPASMIEAVAQGRQAAHEIDAYVRHGSLRNVSKRTGIPDVVAGKASMASMASMPSMPSMSSMSAPRMVRPATAVSHPESGDDSTFSREQASSEARRCLSCGGCSECMECVKVCSADAIEHDQSPTEFELKVGSVILAPGLEEAPPGHGEHRTNILSALQFERMLSSSGPTDGRLLRPSDGVEAATIAFIQCSGALTAGYCSSTCCESTVRKAFDVLESVGRKEARITIFCDRARSAGRDLDRLRSEKSVECIRAAQLRVREISEQGIVRVSYRCQGEEEGGVERHRDFDLAVQCDPVQVARSSGRLADRIGIALNQFGFVKTERFTPLRTSRPGVYVAGSFQEPKGIPEAVAQASGAAGAAMAQLATVRGAMIDRVDYPWERDVFDEAPRIGVFVCQCGRNISSVVDVEQVAGAASKLPGVDHAEICAYTCSVASQRRIRDVIRERHLNRLVVASCSSRTHDLLFRETLRESGLNQRLLASANIRDHCSWVHRDDPTAATLKAVDLVSMAVARARHLKASPKEELPVIPSALVLGGGLAGMTTALSIADQGFSVVLVERESRLGGRLRERGGTLEGDDVQALGARLISDVVSHPKITVHLDSMLARVSGQAGVFTSVLKTPKGERLLEHGVTVVATGGAERATNRHLHGVSPRVMTQGRLESLLALGRQAPELSDPALHRIVMIQCVERGAIERPEHQLCSRVCCSEAIKNALALKRLLPESEIVILGRELRLGGFRAAYFQKACAAGVRFIRWAEPPPEVTENGGRLTVTVRDADSGRQLTIHPDLIALSTGIDPDQGNEALAAVLRISLSPGGFFPDAHPLLRPVDLPNEGEFVCGLAHSPCFIDETIARAQAVAGRAAAILSKPQLEIVGQVACVVPEGCVACATCVRICRSGAPAINRLGKAEIRSAKCLGCGSCAAACPSRTIVLGCGEGEMVGAMIDDLLARGGSVCNDGIRR